MSLRTRDHKEAKRRAALAVKGQRQFADDATMREAPRARHLTAVPASPEGAADAIIAALDGKRADPAPSGTAAPLTPEPSPGDPAGASTGQPAAPELIDAEPIPAAARAGDPGWTDDVRAAAGAAAAPDAPPPPDPEMTNAELAAFGVEAQLWAAEQYARAKVWPKFVAPALAPESKAPLLEHWNKILTYSGAGAMLPPWVTGLLIPGGMLIFATVGIARQFADMAAQQKRAAGDTSPAPGTQPPTEPAGLAAAPS